MCVWVRATSEAGNSSLLLFNPLRSKGEYIGRPNKKGRYGRTATIGRLQ